VSISSNSSKAVGGHQLTSNGAATHKLPSGDLNDRKTTRERHQLEELHSFAARGAAPPAPFSRPLSFSYTPERVKNYKIRVILEELFRYQSSFLPRCHLVLALHAPSVTSARKEKRRS